MSIIRSWIAHPCSNRGITIQPVINQSETKHGRNSVAALDISGDIQPSQNTKNLHCTKNNCTERKNELQLQTQPYGTQVIEITSSDKMSLMKYHHGHSNKDPLPYSVNSISISNKQALTGFESHFSWIKYQRASILALP